MSKKERKVKLSELAEELGYKDTKNFIEDIKNLETEDERIESLKKKRLTVRSSVDFRTAAALKDYILSQREEEAILKKTEKDASKFSQEIKKEEIKKDFSEKVEEDKEKLETETQEKTEIKKEEDFQKFKRKKDFRRQKRFSKKPLFTIKKYPYKKEEEQKKDKFVSLKKEIEAAKEAAKEKTSQVNEVKEDRTKSHEKTLQKQHEKEERQEAKERSYEKAYQEYLRRLEEKKRAKAKRKAKKKKKKEEVTAGTEQATSENELEIKIPSVISVRELAEKLGVDPNELIKELMFMGKLVTVNQTIDFETAAKLAEKFDKIAILEDEEEKELLEEEKKEEQEEHLEPRPPVVTVMGHVDHGKTSLLDKIRNTNVAAREAGGITQHIGASVVEVNTSEGKKKIVFIDTPGHEAFTAMRARGAQVTDIVVLVVAADDGVMPQTIEAINHAKAAKVPIIVAINKIDKPNADPERVKRELSEHGLIPEEWGGDTIMVPVSALTGEGIDELLENIALLADILELKANPNKKARGVVLEAKLDKKRGPVATLLVQEGTLKQGDAIVAGLYAGKIRAMYDDKGRQVKEAGPSMPVEVLGLEGVPEPGDKFFVVEDIEKAREIAQHRQELARESALEKQKKISLEELFSAIQKGEIKELQIVLKADCYGSIEAIRKTLEELEKNLPEDIKGKIKINIIHTGVGPITENDVLLASASNAIVLGFNVRPDSAARKLAEREKVDIRTYRVIYDLVDDVKKALSGLLEPEEKEVILGTAEVRATFKIKGVGTVAGCYVKDGVIRRNANARLIRNGVVIYDGKIASLKRFKDDVKEVQAGYECGIALENFNDIKVGDTIECYEIQKIKREIK